MLIIGNSFKNYALRRIEPPEPTNCIIPLEPYVNEHPLVIPEPKLNVELERAFNDTSIIHFQQSEISRAIQDKIFENKPLEFDGHIDC